MIQIVVLQPTALALLDGAAAPSGGSGRRWVRYLSMPVRNPLTIGPVAGLLVNLAGWTIPDLLWTPASMLAAVAVAVIAAFPTAQNIFLIASRYRLACDAIFASTPASIPVVILASTLLR